MSLLTKSTANRTALGIVALVCLGLLVKILLDDTNIKYQYYISKFRSSELPKIFQEEQSQNENYSPDPIVDWIESNPLFSKFEFPPATSRSVSKSRKRVNVVIIVSSAVQRYDRRRDIRATWWTECKPSFGVVPECIFMTDHQEPSSIFHENITTESEQYGDIRFQKLTGGVEFGFRYLYQVVYVLKHYDFDYFLRMDDDYFFCIQQFFMELPRGTVPFFHWGYTHCNGGATRPEESMLLFSKHLVMTFALQDPNTLKCHPLADQMLGEWAKDLNISKIFRHDYRLHHHPPVDSSPELQKLKDVCSTYIGVHGCYPPHMLTLWKNRGPVRNKGNNLKSNSYLCKVTKLFNSSWIQPPWKYEAKPCIGNPTWDTSGLSRGKFYKGRQRV